MQTLKLSYTDRDGFSRVLPRPRFGDESDAAYVRRSKALAVDIALRVDGPVTLSDDDGAIHWERPWDPECIAGRHVLGEVTPWEGLRDGDGHPLGLAKCERCNTHVSARLGVPS